MRKQPYNKWDILIIISITSLAYGNYEMLGALWPIRIIGAYGLIFVINRYHWFKSSIYSNWVAFLLFWSIWIVLSLIWTPDKQRGLIYTFHMLSMIGCMLFLCYAIQKSNYPFQAIALGWTFFLIIVLPIATKEILTGEHLPSGSYSVGQILTTGQRRIFAAVTFQNLNSLVLMLTLPLPFISIMILSKVSSLYFKLLQFICYLGTSWVLIINASRAGIICLALSTILLIIFLSKESGKKGSFVGIIISTLMIFWLIRNWESIDLFIQIEDRLNGKSSILEDTGRTSLIINGLKAFTNTLGLGGGIMSMNYLYATFSNSRILYAHNLPIEILMEYGFVIAFFLFVLFYKNLLKIQEKKTLESKFIFLYSLLASFLMFALDDCYQSRAGIWIYIALLVGISGLPKGKWVNLDKK